MKSRGGSLLLASALCLQGGGCYSYTAQVADRPAPATAIEVTLNDRGRVALENHVGAEILTVEGTVAAVDDSSFTLQMRRTTSIGGTVTQWAHEPVTFRTEYVRQVRERHFSAGRTALLGGLATAGAVAFAATPLGGKLLGIGNGPSTGGDPGSNSH